MGGVRLVFGAEFRRRWRSWLILAALIAVVGGLALAATAAGRRTATAFPRFVHDHGYDVLIFNFDPLPQLSKLPGVSSVTTGFVLGSGDYTCACTRNLNDSNLTLQSLSRPGMHRVVKLVAGRMPDPASPDELLASYNLETDFGVHVGTVITSPFYTLAQRQALFNDANPPRPLGPTVALHVVGIEEAEAEFPIGAVPTYDLYASQSPRFPAFAYQYLVKLHSTTDLPRFSLALAELHPTFVQNQDSIATAVATSIHPQAVGWWVLALLAALAGLAVIGQALGRQSVVESEEYPTFAALGVERRHLVALGTARNAALAITGALGAIVVAFALSPLTPVGEARLAEPSTGFSFDPLVLLLGAAVIVVVVLGLGIWPALRAARLRIGENRIAPTRPSAIVARVAAAGAPPSAVIGVRHALERGRGAATVPVGTALFGTMLAVMALCGTAVFGASLSHLTATPELYGDAYQFLISNEEGSGNIPAQVTSLEHDPAVTGIMLGTRNEVSINGTSVFAVAGKRVVAPCCCRGYRDAFPVVTEKSRWAPPRCIRLGPAWGPPSTSSCSSHTAPRVKRRSGWSGRRRSPASSAWVGWARARPSPSAATWTPCALPVRPRPSAQRPTKRTRTSPCWRGSCPVPGDRPPSPTSFVSTRARTPSDPRCRRHWSTSAKQSTSL